MSAPMPSVKSLPFCAWMLGAVLLAGAALRSARASQPSTIDALLEVPPVPASIQKVLALGLTSVMADLEFMEAIQVYGDRAFTTGGEKEKNRRGQAIYRLLDYATDFDPQFSYPYVFGSSAIVFHTYDGRVLNLDLGVSLLRKGIAANVEDWRIPFHLSFLLSMDAGDLKGAAEAMADAARRPHHPKYVHILATRLAAAGGTIDTGIELARAAADDAATPELREEYMERLRLLVMERDIRSLAAAVQQFRTLHGQLPVRLTDLVADKLIASIPDEPHGGAYSVDAETGEVKSSAAPRLKLPDTIDEEIREHLKHRTQETEPPR